MNITNWRGFAPASIYDRSSDRFFSDRYRSLLGMEGDFNPAVNTRESEKDFTLEFAVPGMKKEDFKVTVNDGLLTISSERRLDNENSNDGYLSREFSYTSFRRSFTLPKDVDDEHISAAYENGILKVVLPRETVPEENTAERTIAVR
jgi:HSP20 family protein